MNKNVAISILVALGLVFYGITNTQTQPSTQTASVTTYNKPIITTTYDNTQNIEIEEVRAEDSPRCNPNYSGCLKPDASDYDCAGGSGNGPYYTGRVQVIGYDQYGLDRDGDGWGCQ